jgi:hypothetical protein
VKKYLDIGRDFPEYVFDPENPVCPEHGTPLDADFITSGEIDVYDCEQGEFWSPWYLRGEVGRHD